LAIGGEALVLILDCKADSDNAALAKKLDKCNLDLTSAIWI